MIGDASLEPATVVEPAQVTIDPHGSWWLRNQGPQTLVIARASITDEDQQEQQLGEYVGEEEWGELAASGMLLPKPDEPWCRGQLLVPHETYIVQQVGVGKDLVIRYHVKGFLGFLSRGTLRIPTGGC